MQLAGLLLYYQPVSGVCARAEHQPKGGASPMSLAYEILNALAALVTIAGFILERWEEYKRRRMEAGESERPAGTDLSKS